MGTATDQLFNLSYPNLCCVVLGVRLCLGILTHKDLCVFVGRFVLWIRQLFWLVRTVSLLSCQHC